MEAFLLVDNDKEDCQAAPAPDPLYPASLGPKPHAAERPRL